MRRDPSFFEVPADLWDRPHTRKALADRDMDALFRLVGKYAGASQTGIGIRVGISQPEVNQIVRGRRRVSDHHVFERIAEGLDMPASARRCSGWPQPTSRHQACYGTPGQASPTAPTLAGSLSGGFPAG